MPVASHMLKQRGRVTSILLCLITLLRFFVPLLVDFFSLYLRSIECVLNIRVLCSFSTGPTSFLVAKGLFQKAPFFTSEVDCVLLLHCFIHYVVANVVTISELDCV